MAVIGAGISGLAVARELLDRSPGLDLKVLEAGPRSGGTVRTEALDGYLCEVGPSGFLNLHPSTLRLADRLGMADDVVTGCERVRRRYILSRGELRRFPDSSATFLSSDLLSLRARARVLLEPMVPPAPEGVDESVGQFARRRLGREAAELLIDPVISGIYAGDPERLSVRAALPQLSALDGAGKSLIRGLLDARTGPARPGSAAPSAVGRRRYVSFRRGIGSFTDRLADSLGDRLRYGAPVRSVARAPGGGWTIDLAGEHKPLYADVVVSAAPAPAARGYLGPLHPDLERACGHVPYAPVAMVALGYREADVPHPLEGYGYLVPSSEGGSVLGVLWASSIFPGHRSRDGRVLLQAILGGAREATICDEEDATLAWRARTQLHRALGIEAVPRLQRVYRHRVGIPQYEVGHARRLQAAEASLREFPGLFLCGNAFRGIGLNACTREAERVADGVAAYTAALSEGARPPLSA